MDAQIRAAEGKGERIAQPACGKPVCVRTTPRAGARQDGRNSNAIFDADAHAKSRQRHAIKHVCELHCRSPPRRERNKIASGISRRRRRRASGKSYAPRAHRCRAKRHVRRTFVTDLKDERAQTWHDCCRHDATVGGSLGNVLSGCDAA